MKSPPRSGAGLRPAAGFPARLQGPAATAQARPGPLATPIVPLPPQAKTSLAAATALLRPQRLLQQALQGAGRHQAPSGLGLDSAAVRARMVQRLRAGGVHCDAVLQAFARVERHRFVDTALANQAYEDTSLPIGLGQTISKPSVVAHMLALLFQGPQAQAQGRLGRVLEIGTGCGYQTALLALLARNVVSIERLKPLHEKARDNLAALRQGQVAGAAEIRLVFGDGCLGHAPRAPYDCIVSAAGGDDVPAAWIEQLAEGGRLVAPSLHPGQGGQALLVVDRGAQGLSRQWLDPVKFVPLKSGTQ